MGTVPTLLTTIPAARLASSTAVSILQAAGEAGGQGGDDGVAGAGDVEDLAGAGGRVIDARVARRRAKDADSLLAHRDGQEFEVVFGDQSLAGGEEFVGVVGGDAGCGGELAEVGADRRCAGVLAEVGGLGVGEDGNACGARGADDGFAESGR